MTRQDLVSLMTGEISSFEEQGLNLTLCGISSKEGEDYLKVRINGEDYSVCAGDWNAVGVIDRLTESLNALFKRNSTRPSDCRQISRRHISEES